MPYAESLNEQNPRLAERYAEVSGYLTELANASEARRRTLWRLPSSVTAADYEAFIEPMRGRVAAMIGYPPPGQPVATPATVEQVGADEDGTFYRVRMELMRDGLSAYGLLISPSHPAPASKSLLVAIHGGGGTPELAVSLTGPNNYNDMGRRFARRGHVVWLPACYERVTFDESEKPAEVHRILDSRARMAGTTLAAIDAYTIIASTARVLRSPHCAADHAVAAGLSYGGFRSMLVCALSELFRACISSCYFNDRRAMLESAADQGGFSDLFFSDLLAVATDVELCRLVCPRPLFIEVGAHDELFPAAGAARAAAEVGEVYRQLHLEDRFAFQVFDGGHEFSGIRSFEFLDDMGL